MLLNEPDITFIYPAWINHRFTQLTNIYWRNVANILESDEPIQDFNLLADSLAKE